MGWGAIARMGHVAVQTTRRSDSVRDATDILGLRVTGEGGSSTFLTASDIHHELVYIESDHEGIDHIGLVAAGTAGLDAVRRRVLEQGLPILSTTPLEDGLGDGFVFAGPEGFVYEIHVEDEVVRAPERGHGPDRFGHINIHPVHIESYRAFLQEVLDFRVSDVIGDDFAYFLRCNSDHHGIALVSGRGSMHHHAWQAQSMIELGRLADRLELAGRRLIWGPVRHGAGHNIAAYFVEPSGGVIELYTDMEQIYDDDRAPIHWSMDDHRWYNRWGVYRGEDFRSHGLLPARQVRLP